MYGLNILKVYHFVFNVFSGGKSILLFAVFTKSNFMCKTLSLETPSIKFPNNHFIQSVSVLHFKFILFSFYTFNL
jgi:hypothetical protein